MSGEMISTHQDGVILVAVAAQLSLVATIVLITILTYHRLRPWKPNSTSMIGSEELCLKFLRSQFALLFLDLLASDAIQAMGFVLNFTWVGESDLQDSSICVAQGVLIQLGDTSGAFATLAIAIHTFVVLIIRNPPSTSTLLIFLGLKWAVVLVLSMIGPIAFATEASGAFYGPAGGWCWISSSYSWQRLCLHYVWLFTAGAASAAIYGLIFVTIRRRIRTHLSQTTSDRSAEETSMESAARKMLVYPLCYLFLMLPLGVYRVAGISGHPWELSAQLVCGSIFTLAGLVDSVVFCWTRNIFSIRGRSHPKKEHISSGIPSCGSIQIPIEKAPKTYGLGSVSPEAMAPLSPKRMEKPSLASRLNGSAIQFMPAKYCLATIDMNSFDDTALPSQPASSSALR